MKTIKHHMIGFPKLVLGTVLALAMTAGAQAAVIYNVVSDFSEASNPNGAWSYLYDVSLAAGGAHDGNYNLLTELNGGGAVGWSQPGGFGARMILTDALGGQYWVPAARTHLTSVTASPAPTYQWLALILTWTAPSEGLVDVSYQVSNVAPAADAVNIALDKYAGGIRTDLVSIFSLASGTSSNVVANAISVNAGDQIQFYRDGYVNQQGQIILGPTSQVSFTAIPEPSTWALLAISLTTVMLVRRRRSRA